MVYTGPRGPLLLLPKTLEPTRVDETRCYGGRPKREVIDAERDLLADAILGRPGEPGYDQVAACLPPIRNTAPRRTTAHTFVGTLGSLYPASIFYSGRTRKLNPVVIAPEIEEAIGRETLSEGLIGGWLPVVRLWYPISESCGWEMVVFGVAEAPVDFMQPVLHRLVRIDGGRITEIHHIDTVSPHPVTTEAEPADFYRELFRLHAFWSTQLQDAMQLDLPERWIPDFCRHALVLEAISHCGPQCRYGIIHQDGLCYGVPQCNGFQDTLTEGVTALLEWGLFDTARSYLDSYLEHYVAEDGAIRMRGPEVAQYGRMLEVIARYYRYTGDARLLHRHDGKIRALADVLIDRRRQSQRLSPQDPAYGMITGWDESDIYSRREALTRFDVPYFSNTTEAWRGFRDLGLVWERLGADAGNEELVGRGRRLLAEAESMVTDILNAIERSILRDTDPPCLPLIAGCGTPFDRVAWRAAPESFDQSRTYAEMLHSGLLSRETVRLILDYCSAHTGTRLGILSDKHRVSDGEDCITPIAFRVYGQAYGLIQHDMVRELLLFYYAHAAHLHTRGTWSVFESVDLDRDRGWHAPYCGPAQLTIPTVTKWMLVFEDPREDVLWITKAAPRRWLEDGNAVKVRDAPTSWGRISFEILSRVQSGTITATIHLPREAPHAVRLRLRAPEPWRLCAVTVNGSPWTDFDGEQELVSIPGDIGATVHVQARLEKRPSGTA